MKKRKFFRKLLLLIAIVAVAIAATPLLPLSPLKNSVELKLSRTLGRKVTIESVRLNLIKSPHLILTGLTAREDPAFGGGVFLKANEVRAGFDALRSLRDGQIVIDSITLKSPRIDLIRNGDGVWSWTTLGKQSPEAAAVSRLASETVAYSSMLALPSEGSLSASTLRELRIENASVKLLDNAEAKSSEVLYKNIDLNASLSPQTSGDSKHGNRATGNLVARSEDDGEGGLFKATLPFDLKIDNTGGGEASGVAVSGTLGPGPIETNNISIGAFAINGEINSNRNAPLTGSGKMSADDLDIHTANLSERVANALKLDQIGDMSAGTSIASLETDFQISQGTVHTTASRIQQLDGLGDATAPSGSFKIESSLIVDYAATVVLSAEATSRVKSMSATIGLMVTILESNNRVSVPINVTGDVRNPEVQVDVSRVF